MLFNKKPKDGLIFEGVCAEIWFTNEAVSRGVFEEFQKEIRVLKKKVVRVNGKVFKNEKVIEEIPFTKPDARAVIKAYRIPMTDMTEDLIGKEFKFNIVDALSGLITKIIPR